MTGNCGTVQWMAPEVLANQRYSEWQNSIFLSSFLSNLFFLTSILLFVRRKSRRLELRNYPF